LVVLSGPAGVGKTTVAGRLLGRAGFVRSVSATTRNRREGEVDGRDYHFVDRERYGRMVAEGELIEHAEVFGNGYGTPKAPLREAINRREVVLLVIDVEGGRQVSEKRLDAFLVFLMPPDMTELQRRLEGRATETENQKTIRLSRADKEIEQAKELYDALVVNRDLGGCVEEVAKLIEERRKELKKRLERGERLYPGLEAKTA